MEIDEDDAVVAVTEPHGWVEASGYSSVAVATGYDGQAITKLPQSVAVVTEEKSTAKCGGQSVAVATARNSRAIALGQCSVAVAASAAADAYANAGSVAVAAVHGAAAAGEIGSALVLVRRDADGHISHARAVIVGQDGIEPEVYYCLDQDGNIVEAPDPCDEPVRTLAEQFAAEFGGDGTKFETIDGRDFNDVLAAYEAGAEYSRRLLDPQTGLFQFAPGTWAEHVSGDPVRYVFPDDSAIVVAGGAWDIEGDQPFSWRG